MVFNIEGYEITIHEDYRIGNDRYTRRTYTKGKQVYNYIIKSNLPSESALKNLAKELLKIIN